jgi:hypothetical protein
MIRPILFLVSIIWCASIFAQKTAITAEELKKDVSFLASDSLKGRKPGTPESFVAAGYIRDQFSAAGLKLIGFKGFQYFDITTDVATGNNNSFIYNGLDAKLQTDFIPLAFSGNGTVDTTLVFAGFGFDINIEEDPDGKAFRWSDFSGLDVRGKWVMIMRGDPEPDSANTPFLNFSELRSKILTLKDKGAAGALVVTPRSVEKEDKLMPLVSENNDITAGIPVIHVTREFANKLLAFSERNIDTLEQTIIRTKKTISFETTVRINATTDLVQKQARAANVVAMLEGADEQLRNEYLVIGAHYDHLGMGGPGSGSRMPDTVAVHNGADDNASGTAMVMALARQLASERQKIRRSIIFVAFSAEEMGLLGSKYFVNHPPVDIKSIKAMFNFDMVGRFDKENNSISVSGTGTSVESDTLLRLLETGLPFKVVHSPDGYGPSDHAAFYSSNIPVFYFNTGVHTDYHTPFDDTEKLDFETQKIVGDFAASVVLSVDSRVLPLTFRESGKKESAGRSGRKLKVTLGIMPDFAGTEKSGLRIDGVTKEGPADKGGMKKGDIIVAINGMKVGNIYEYMSRLQKLKHGMTVNVEVVREGKPQILIIQL